MKEHGSKAGVFVSTARRCHRGRKYRSSRVLKTCFIFRFLSCTPRAEINFLDRYLLFPRIKMDECRFVSLDCISLAKEIFGEIFTNLFLRIECRESSLIRESVRFCLRVIVDW